MAVDWSRGDLEHSLVAYFVDPTTYSVRDVADMLEIGGSMTINVNSDVKANASISLIGEQHGSAWDGSSAVSLVHVVSDYTGELMREKIFTGFVTECSWSTVGDMTETSLQLQSTLYGAKAETFGTGWFLPKGSHAVASFKQLCGFIGRKYRVDGNVGERTYGYDLTFEPGRTALFVLDYFANDAGCIVTPDADGYIHLSKYVQPSQRAATYTVDARDERGTLIGDVDIEDSSINVPGRYVVYAKSSDDWAFGEAYASGRYSRASRGYLLDKFDNESNLYPFTSAHARELAKSRLSSALADTDKMQHSMMYRPLNLLDVERFVDADGSASRWYVQSAELDFQSWTWKVTLKGGWA